VPLTTAHCIFAADRHSVPTPFRAFAVRSEEPQHAHAARAPYGRVHRVRSTVLVADTLAALAREGRARLRFAVFSDILHAPTTLQELAAVAPRVPDWAGLLAGALQGAGVLGDDPGVYRRSVETRIDFLGARGAGFHNDVKGHWSRCLFWLLVLEASDVEFVMPHAGIRLELAPGDLLVFDPAMAHGLCRPADHGQAVAVSFEQGPHCRQMFLTGELLLSDAQWAALGAPWQPVEVHQGRGALDLMLATFDDRTGAIQRLRTLRDGMLRSTCHVDTVAD
jgi:hypothetical protein